MLSTQLKYDLLMFSREVFYMFFTIIIPPVTYIFMGQLYGEMTYDHGLNYAQSYTPSFILLITFTVIFFAFGFDQVNHRITGVEKRIRLSPVPKNILLASSILRAIIITTLGYLMILSIGLVMYDLSFVLLDMFSSYAFFIAMNIVLLIMASAIYSLFDNINSALVFSIVIMQIVIFTGGFAQPINLMPNFIQVSAKLNPLYHMNNMFIDVWNGQLSLTIETILAGSYIGVLLFVSVLIIRFMHRRKI